MAKRMYADVKMNGQLVNLAVRASSEKEARTKLETFTEYRGVSEIFEVSPNPPRRMDKEEDNEIETPLRHRKRHLGHYTGRSVHNF